jgi:PIN domain nuclease of toxin-antitoxin system
MRLLLDTHIALWAVIDDPKLSKSARDLIGDPANEIFVSAGSLWEIAIKHALARGTSNDMPVSGEEALGYFQDAGYQLLDITPAHAIGVESLPSLHADPFDRILVAQALTEPLRLLTHDPRIASYSDSIITV